MADTELSTISGADLTAFRSAMAGAGFMVPISSVEISSPVSYVDIALPSGYDVFELIAVDFRMDVGDLVAFALSSDGGVTFHNGGSDYEMITVRIVKSGSDPVEIAGFKGSDALATVTGSTDDGNEEEGFAAVAWGRTMKLSIFPGATGRKASVLSFVGATTGPTADGPQVALGRAYLAATGRQNAIRLQPYGNDDTPPTSIIQLTGGTLHLFGIPSA